MKKDFALQIAKEVMDSISLPPEDSVYSPSRREALDKQPRNIMGTFTLPPALSNSFLYDVWSPKGS
jgi:hypothetical protein